MHPVEIEGRQKGWPVLVEIDSYKVDLYPTQHWVHARAVSQPVTDNASPKWLDNIQEGREFTAATSETAFEKGNPEEKEYFNSLEKKYKRRTNIIYLLDCKKSKKESKFNNPLKSPGFYTFKALGCPTT